MGAVISRTVAPVQAWALGSGLPSVAGYVTSGSNTSGARERSPAVAGVPRTPTRHALAGEGGLGQRAGGARFIDGDQCIQAIRCFTLGAQAWAGARWWL